jgi:tetratricopeptide (TPR) repeat protein
MKIGIRKPSINKRISARSSWKRYVRHSLGLKAPRGYGIFTNPKKAIYNRVYYRSSIGVDRLFSSRKRKSKDSGIVGAIVSLSILIALIIHHWVFFLSLISGIIFVYILVKYLVHRSNQEKDIISIALGLNEKGDCSSAIELLTRNIENNNTFEVNDLLGSLYSQKRDFKNALKYLKIALLKGENNDLLKYMVSNKICMIYLEMRMDDRAEELFKTISFKKRKYPSDLMNIAFILGNFYYSNENYIKAKYYLNKVIKYNSNLNNSKINTVNDVELYGKASELMGNIGNRE